MARFSRALLALVLVLGLLAPSAPAGAEVHAEPAGAEGQAWGSVRIAARAPLVGTGEDAFSVDRLYRAFFLRAADDEGLAYWLEQYFGGMSLATIAQAFTRSQEFRSEYGSLSNADFVRLVYRNVLEREPETSGFDYWTGRLAAGVTRGQMMVGFSDSGEFKVATDLIGSGADTLSVERLYQAYFRRAGDEQGLAYWRSRYTDLASLLQISQAFAGSREFVETYGSLSNAAFVDLVYRNVLGREPDATGRQHWRTQLSEGMPRGTMMVGFSDSAEFKRNGGADQPGANPCPTRDESGLPSAPADQFAFLFFDSCEAPIQWAPCQPVDIVANFAGAPAPGGDSAFARDALVSALEQLSVATRTEWNLVDETTERAPDDQWNRPLSDPNRYGSGYSPVLVSWAPEWTTSATAYASPYWTTVSDPITERTERRIVTGQVVIDADWQPTDRTILVSAFLHELGHIAGLDHVQDSQQSMFPIFRQRASFADGDEAGLARVGSWLVDCPA